jgi:hypothetical protein
VEESHKKCAKPIEAKMQQKIKMSDEKELSYVRKDVRVCEVK